MFLEDTAGLIGAVLAFLGIFLGRLLNNIYLDPIASILIGMLLAGVAMLLGRESGVLLVGARTNRARIKRVDRSSKRTPRLRREAILLTMQLGPDQVLLTMDIRFRRGLNVPDFEAAVDRLESRIRQAEPTIERIFIEADSLKPGARRPLHAA